MTLARRIRERIVACGPMPFDEYMGMCLYDPHGGFFATGPLRSVTVGDFLTSPEVSSWFGRILGRFVAAEQARLTPGDVALVEAGAGSGSLLRSLLDECGFEAPPVVWAVEASSAARRTLAEIVPEARVVASSDAVPAPMCSVVIANELLDNLPVALVQREEQGWAELHVAVVADELALVPVRPRSHAVEWAERYGIGVHAGGRVEVQGAAADWVRDMVSRLSTGTLVVIDYGGSSGDLVSRRAEGTLRTYRSHHLGPDPLLEPGATDITVDVDFDAMRHAAEDAGAAVRLMRQDDFLAEWGLRDAIAAMRSREEELARAGDTTGRVEAHEERIAAETLLHPRGLGDFRVLIARV